MFYGRVRQGCSKRRPRWPGTAHGRARGRRGVIVDRPGSVGGALEPQNLALGFRENNALTALSFLSVAKSVAVGSSCLDYSAACRSFFAP
jgi:hypothetical protein